MSGPGDEGPGILAVGEGMVCYGLISENSQLSGISHRVAVVRAADVSPLQVVSGIEDPLWMAPSPFDDVVLVVGSQGNKLYVLEAAAAADPPWALRGEIEYNGPPPALPSCAVGVARGPLEGIVLVAELTGVRRIRFSTGGRVEDLGLWEPNPSDGWEAMVGAIGVQP